MSEKQFEDFLAKRLIDWGKENLISGYRYQFQSPDLRNSIKLFNALSSLSTLYVEIKNIRIPCVEIADTKLLIIIHSENEEHGFGENFISHIRDEVAAQQGQIKNSSLLVIHNSQLDTLINSAENIAQKGFVWHPSEIMQSLYSLIEPTDPSSKVSKCLLNHRFDQIVEDGATMFGFEELYKAMRDDGDLRFDEIGLLNDPVLNDWSGPEGQINARLEKNKRLYEKIDYIVHEFPTNLEEKLGEQNLGPAFVKKYFSDDKIGSWKEKLEFSACEQEQQNNKDNMLELEKEICSDGQLYSRAKAETKAGRRDKHLVYLLDEQQVEFQIVFSFLGDKVEKKQCQITIDNDNQLEILQPDNTGGKRSRITVKGQYDQQIMFFNFRVKRDKTSETHNFRVAVMRKGEFYEEAFKYCYLVDPKKQKLILQTEDSSLKIADSIAEIELTENGQSIDNSEFGIIDFESLSSESDFVEFKVKGHSTALDFKIEGAVASGSLYLPLLLDKQKFSKLYSDDFYAVLNRANTKVQLENNEVAPKGKRLTLLQWERDLVAEDILYKNSNSDLNLKISDFLVSYPELASAYSELFEYLRVNGTLPSLAGWGPSFSMLVSSVVTEFNNAIHEISYDVMLSKAQKELAHIGFAIFKDEEYITPFHPLVLAYHLQIVDSIKSDGSDSYKNIPRVTQNRLTAEGLIPFVYDSENGFSYTRSESENQMWLKLVPQQATSYDFVRKLVREKTSEFHDAFSSLFSNGPRSKIIINSVNNGKNRHVFLGLIDFIKQHKDKVCQIHVNLYDDQIEFSEFDRFADTNSYDAIKQNYGLDKGGDKDIGDTVVDLIRSRLTYSKFKNVKLDNGSFAEQAYAHLTFFKNNNRVQPTDVNVNEELSGVIAGGLLTGEASTNKEGSYFTAFGLKGIEVSESIHLQIAERLSGLIKPSRKANEQYSRSKALALAVSDKFKQLLSCSYKSSIWTTIIDPKVTLDFFDSEQNVVLIHYSDNYTNSVNYDAITVTEESELYKKALEQDQGGIIEEFNAFNGEWLLKMITSNANETKEKKGIIGAYKFINCLLQKSEITWVPLSVAEMIRVAGNIGLKMTDSDFSRNVNGYTKGLISDDVLFVGFTGDSIVLLPLEVKTGKKQTHSKGIAQAKELKRYLVEDILGGDTIVGKLNRSLFIRQILMQVDKYKLYHLYKDDYFEQLLARREWWLQGSFDIQDIVDYPSGFLVSHVENDAFVEPTFEVVADILKAQLPISLLNKFIKTPLQELFSEVKPEKLCHINEKFVLDGEVSLEPITETAKVEHDIEPTEALMEVKEPSVEELSEDLPVEENKSVTPTDSLKVLIGHSVQDDEPVLWEPTNTAKFMNTNSGIIGTMGTGKTQCTKSVITQLYRKQHNNVDGKPIGVLIFDYKSDYVDNKFTEATSAKNFKLYKLPYNPLSLFGDTPMLPVHTAAGFSETMAKAYGLGKKQQLKLENLILEAYELAGIHPENPSTWKKTAPTIENIWDLFIEQEKVEEDSLYAALSKLTRFKIFETDPDKMMSLYELVDGVTVVELAGYPGEVQNLVVALTLDLFYSQMQKQGKPEVQGDFRQVSRLILVDEADNFMSQNFISLRRILKEGREYGVGVILSTQDITHFKTGENDYSAYILSWIVHRVSQIKNQDIKSIFNKDDKISQDHLMSSIRGLEKHHSLYVDGDKKIVKIKDMAFWELL